MIKTVSLTADTETKVEISGGYNVGVINRTTGMLYASRKSGISAGADDVAAIPAGDSYVIRAADDTVYLLATAAGDVQLESIGVTEVFKIAAARSSSGGGEGGTVDEVARQTIETHANNEKIHLTAEKAIEAVATTISNPNLLINPDFQINQRGQAEYATAGYGYDRWRLGRSTGIVRAEGGKCTITATDTADPQHIFQTLENNYAGMTLTFAVTINNIADCTGAIHLVNKSFATIGSVIYFAGAGRYTHTVTVPNDIDTLRLLIRLDTLANVGASFTFSELELEPSSAPTPFVPPDPATELAKCQRYYQVRTTGDIDPVDLRPSMRTITDIREREGGKYEYIAEL